MLAMCVAHEDKLTSVAYSFGVTFIAVAIPVARTDAVSRALESAQAAKLHGADLVEWRVDTLAEDSHGSSAIVRLVQESPLPCIVTVRDESEGGAFSGSDDERIAVWRAASKAVPPPAYIDVELSTYHTRAPMGDSAREIARISNMEKTDAPRVILSFHDFRGRPPGLSSRVAEMWSDPGSAIAKVVWTARTARDNIEAFELLASRAKPTIALCMGEHGLMSRVLAPKFGGFLTYARADDHGTAPGQPTVEELVHNWGFRSIDQSTKVFGVIAYPVSHSRSPEIHNRWFRAANLNARLFAIAVAPSWEPFKATLAELFGYAPLDFCGVAVSMPHKENAIRFVKEFGGVIEQSAQRIGAANTIGKSADGKLFARNTDADGVVESLANAMRRAGGDGDLRGKRIAILGAGGAARAAAFGVGSRGASVVIANRTASKAKKIAEEFARALGDAPALDVKAKALSALSKERFDVIINCTSVGMDGGPAAGQNPLPAEVVLDEHVVVMDAVYAPAKTALLLHAEQCGAKCVGGWEMLIAQAAHQFEGWTGKRPLVGADPSADAAPSR
ncbi:MAG: shikimate dehydrogenase [Planctomycetota bacterium]|nr:shikimate dehydrogenase [Planctomycetota bacterium]